MVIVATRARGRCCFPIVMWLGQCPSATKCRGKVLSIRTSAEEGSPRRVFQAAACAVNSRHALPLFASPSFVSYLESR
jgi:hypothetical protein